MKEELPQVAGPWLSRWLTLKYWLWKRPKWFVLRWLVCSWRGHTPGDTGHYWNSPMMDCWCRRCDKLYITMPRVEDPRYDQLD